MIVHYIGGYYSDLAHKANRRTEPFWDSYFYIWAVKVGTFKKGFNLPLKGGTVAITSSNFNLVRSTFGRFIVAKVSEYGKPHEVMLVPIPSKDALPGARTFRSLEMLSEALRGTQYEASISAALSWGEAMPRAHQGGSRGREFLREHLACDTSVSHKKVIVIDDLVVRGGSLLAAKDVIEASGGNVLCAITCGKTVYDQDSAPFGDHKFVLESELSDVS